jgi:ribosomal protein S18 acetylase RimI-like enzyme
MTVSLREPYNYESDECVRLIYISGPNLFSYIYIEKEPKIYDILKTFFNRRGTTFTRKNIIVEEENGKIRGLIIAHPVGDLHKLVITELKCIKEMNRGLFNFLKTLFKMFFRLKVAIYYPRLKKNELFICNLAVFKEYRGKGIASKLLKKTEEIAIKKGLNNLSLYVEIDNDIAIRFYKKYGFQEVKKAVFPKRYNKHYLFGFYKMVKIIGGA